jgi:hypothetical protein
MQGDEERRRRRKEGVRREYESLDWSKYVSGQGIEGRGWKDSREVDNGVILSLRSINQ